MENSKIAPLPQRRESAYFPVKKFLIFPSYPTKPPLSRGGSPDFPESNGGFRGVAARGVVQLGYKFPT